MAYNNVTKYYFQKPDDFYQRDDIRKLERIPDGYEMITIYEKIIIETLNKDGLLVQIFGNKKEKYSINDLVHIFQHSEEMIKRSLNMFLDLNMAEEIEDKILFFPDALKYTKKTTVGAERKKDNRNSKSNFDEVDKCPLPMVDKCLPTIEDKCLTELELKEELEPKSELKKELKITTRKEKENIIYNTDTGEIIEPEIISNDDIACKEIIDYLNSVTDSNYRYKSPKTQKEIKARLNEGFMIDDFKIVINKKNKEWNKTEYAKYLRPETLFSNKFESYLNQKEVVESKGKVFDVLEEMYNGRIKF